MRWVQVTLEITSQELHIFFYHRLPLDLMDKKLYMPYH